MILRVRHLIEHSRRVTEDGGIVVRQGKIERILRGRRSIDRAMLSGCGPLRDLGDGILAPGFVNAHAHLELGRFAGRLPDGQGFEQWIFGMLKAHRNSRPGDYASGVESGVQRLLTTGTTSVGDIVSTREGARATRGGIRSVLYREVLDAWNPERTGATLSTVRRALPVRALTNEGISPHAPYTTSTELLGQVARLARRRRVPISIHWSETRAETDWLERGTGPLRDVLPASPKVRGLELIERMRLLGKSTSLVHGNHPRKGEPERIARAGATLIHCPGTHAFFGRGPFPWRKYQRAGVRLALGTDSLASNHDLDIRREMRLALESNPSLSPSDVFRMATDDAARAVGLGGVVGELRPGRQADLVLYQRPPDGSADALTNVIRSNEAVLAVWIAGRRVSISQPEEAYT